MQSQQNSGDIAILAYSSFFLLFQSKHKKSENSSYISSKYYNTYKLLTTKEAKMRKSREKEVEGEERRDREMKRDLPNSQKCEN